MGPENFFTSGTWIFPILMMVLCAVLLPTAFRGGGGPPWMRRRDAHERPPSAETPPSPLDVLKMRFARGEITKEEFEEMRRAL